MSIKSFPIRCIEYLLKYKYIFLTVVIVLTAFFAYHLAHLRIATDFFSLYPPKHEHIKLYNKYRHMFGTANILVGAVEVKKGDIYTVKTIEKIDGLTRDIISTPGVNTQQVISITHPKVKKITVGYNGVQIEPLIGQLPKNQRDLDLIREGVDTTAGIWGVYISGDLKTATIFAGVWEEGVDPDALYNRLEILKAKYNDDNIKIRFTGFPALYAYIYHLAPQVYLVLVCTLVIMFLLLFFYFRNIRGLVLPMISMAVSAVWGLGFASLLGIALDPLILVIPILISARCLSHSTQKMARYEDEFIAQKDKYKAIVTAYGEMLTPSMLAHATDATGVIMISVVTIPLMREMSFFSVFWIISMIPSIDILNPIWLSFMKPPTEASQKRYQASGHIYDFLARILAIPMSKNKYHLIALGIALAVFISGGIFVRDLKVGNTETGAVMLYPNHPYNEDNRFINSNFAGSNQLVIIAEGKKEGAIKSPDALAQLEEMQAFMVEHGGAGATLTITDLLKTSYQMFHEGIPAWQMIPEKIEYIYQIYFLIEQGSDPGEMDRYIDPTWTNATITCYYPRYDNTIIKESIENARKYIQEHERKGSDISFKLAGGIMGILYAVNKEVEWSYWASMIAVFSAVFVMCSLVFRSIVAGIVLMIPLMLSQILCDSFMLMKGIDLNINSLPVASIAVGTGVDYGIYLVARIVEELRLSNMDYDIASLKAIRTTGRAIIFTATTMVGGVILWTFMDLKFQAEMGLLLGLLMFLNMVNALVFIPILVKRLKPNFVTKKLGI